MSKPQARRRSGIAKAVVKRIKARRDAVAQRQQEVQGEARAAYRAAVMAGRSVTGTGAARITPADAWSRPYGRDGDRWCAACEKVLYRNTFRAEGVVASVWAKDDVERPKLEKRSYPCPVAPWKRARHLTARRARGVAEGRASS